MTGRAECIADAQVVYALKQYLGLVSVMPGVRDECRLALEFIAL